MRTLDPANFAEVFKANFDAKALEALVDGYAEDAVLDLGDGNAARGRDQIRSVLENFLAPGLPITVNSTGTLASGDVAVTRFDWKIEGTAPDGTPVNLGGSAIDVLVRTADGSWQQKLDLPFGQASA